MEGEVASPSAERSNMTINDIIISVEQRRPGSCMAIEDYVSALNVIEADIYHNIIACHEGAGSFVAHSTAEDVLQVPDMYGDLYKFYILAQMDLANSDITRYSNNMILYNNMLSEYRDWYIRNHMPISHRRVRWQ